MPPFRIWGNIYFVGMKPASTLTAIASPGHTPDAMSYIFEVQEGDRKLIAGNKDAFVDPTGWAKFAQRCIRDLKIMIEEENEE